MPNLWTLLRGRQESGSQRSLDDWGNGYITFGGLSYPLIGTSGGLKQENIENHFVGYVNGAYKANGVVFAVILARMLLFTEARFQWQRIIGGRPADLFGTAELGLLERPWPNGTTGELLARMEQDVSLAGNAYVVRETGRLRRLRPDWVSILLSAPPAEAAQCDVIGYAYQPGGAGDPSFYLPDQMCHWSPVPDPDALYRGMSWLNPIVPEIIADSAATRHKGKFFANGATLSTVVSVKEGITPAQFREFVQATNDAHQGVDNAYKPMYVGGGADVKLVGADLRQLDFRATQGAGETRICAAGGVPPVIVGLSEGLQAATYSNYGQARRHFGDHWARPQWRSVCAALESILTRPAGGSRLWYDDRDIAFLREDRLDSAEIEFRKAQTIRALTDAGYTAETVVPAVLNEDLSMLQHSGLFSVQLQPPGTTTPALPGGDGGNAA